MDEWTARPPVVHFYDKPGEAGGSPLSIAKPYIMPDAHCPGSFRIFIVVSTYIVWGEGG
jgi:hypothetical protein